MSEILVNKLTGTSTAGSILVTGEGNSTTTNLQQGLCKAWIKLNGDAFGLLDSFNTAGVTDNGTGDYTMTVSNAFGNINYNFVGATNGDGTNGAGLYKNDQVAATTTVLRVRTKLFGNQDADRNEIGVSLFGDLA